MAVIKTVFFDLDDTLFDHQHSSRSGLDAARRAHTNLEPLTLDAVEQDYLAFSPVVWPRVLQGIITMEDSRVERFQLIFQKYGWDLSADEGLVLSNCYREAYQTNRRAVPGVISLLESLRAQHIKVGVVTNNLQQEQEEKLAFCGLGSLIDFLVVSETVGAAKPEPLMYETALRIAGCAPDEAVMVGDSWRDDVLGARAVGIRAVWFNRTGKPIPDPALADELRAFEPLGAALRVVLGTRSDQ